MTIDLVAQKIDSVSKTVARAVVDRIATDRCCNTENIGDAVFRELSVALVAEQAKKPPQPQVGYSANSSTITLDLRDVHDFFDTLNRYNAPPGVQQAAQHLFAQLRPVQSAPGHAYGLAGSPPPPLKRGMFP
jgi:hypothetical protein